MMQLKLDENLPTEAVRRLPPAAIPHERPMTNDEARMSKQLSAFSDQRSANPQSDI